MIRRLLLLLLLLRAEVPKFPGLAASEVAFSPRTVLEDRREKLEEQHRKAWHGRVATNDGGCGAVGGWDKKGRVVLSR